jgi:hypothetical protein
LYPHQDQNAKLWYLVATEFNKAFPSWVLEVESTSSSVSAKPEFGVAKGRAIFGIDGAKWIGLAAEYHGSFNSMLRYNVQL